MVPTFNAKQGAFGAGKMKSGQAASPWQQFAANRPKLAGMNGQQRRDFMAERPGVRNAFGAWKQNNQGAINDWRTAKNAGAFAPTTATQLTQGALAAQNNAVPPENTIPAQDPQLLSQIDPSSEIGQRILNAMSGTVPPQATTSPPASDYAGAMVPAQGTAPPAAPPPAASTPAQGAFARQRRDQTPGIGGQDANWWRQVGYTPHFVSQLPGLLQQAGDYNYGGMDPSTVNWSDPRAIRRAAAFLPYDVSQYRSNGRGRGGGSVWNGWKPGDFEGRGMPISAPPSMLPNSGGA